MPVPPISRAPVVVAVQPIGHAQGLSRETGVSTDCFVLKRVRRTASQVGLSPEQRRRNVAGAFMVETSRAAAMRGKNIVMVDDVVTTGATVEACARVLKRPRRRGSTF